MRKLLLIAAAVSVLAGCAHDRSRLSEAKADRPYCLQETGSRLPNKAGECNSQPGRSISREEMDRSGAFTTFDAIRRIDPSVR